MKRQEGPLNVVTDGQDVRIGINYKCAAKDWPDFAIDKIAEDLAAVEPADSEADLMRQALDDSRDRIEEILRDGQAKIDGLERGLAIERDMNFNLVIAFIIAVLAFAITAIALCINVFGR